MTNLRAWIRQPTTVAGISAMAGTIVAMFLQQIGWAQALPLLVGSAMSIILPDNTVAKSQVQSLASEIVNKFNVQKDVK